MSRIGNKPIAIPSGVTVEVKDSRVEIKGPNGTLGKNFPAEIAVRVEKGQISVQPKENLEEDVGHLHGLTRTLIANLVQGVVQPWKKELEIQGVGYRASKQGQVLNLALGFSHPVNFALPELVQFSVDAKQTLVTLLCPDKDLLGAVASKIRSLRPPEPYKGKGIRYVGEHILRKAGKAAAAIGSSGPGGKK